MKTICIYHSIDLDGWMSAAIVKHWFLKNNENGIVYESPYSDGTIVSNKENEISLSMFGFNYGNEIPNLSKYDKVIMCDISFPPDYMKHLVDRLSLNFIWIDHHISAIKSCPQTLSYANSVDDVMPVSGLRRTDFAACELTWLYFMTDSNKTHFDDDDIKNIPEIIRLLGRYDCFGHKGTDEETKVLEFQYGARQCISNYEEAYKYLLAEINPIQGYNIINNILSNGRAIYQYLCTEAKQTYKNGFKIKFTIPAPDSEGYFIGKVKKFKFICINKERFNPINFGIDYHKDGYDGCACFHYANGMWNFSLYNDNEEVDCSQIAKQFGGGGHKGAAGFRINDINEIIKQ